MGLFHLAQMAAVISLIKGNIKTRKMQPNFTTLATLESG